MIVSAPAKADAIEAISPDAPPPMTATSVSVILKTFFDIYIVYLSVTG